MIIDFFFKKYEAKNSPIKVFCKVKITHKEDMQTFQGLALTSLVLVRLVYLRLSSPPEDSVA